jgi:hypothetical protein
LKIVRVENSVNSHPYLPLARGEIRGGGGGGGAREGGGVSQLKLLTRRHRALERIKI